MHKNNKILILYLQSNIVYNRAAESNIEIIQRLQNKVIRAIVDTPRCVSNSILQKDTSISTVEDEITQHSTNWLRR